MKLDTKKPFGTTYGESPYRYEQIGTDGKNHHFNAQGDEVDPKTGKEIEPPKPK